MAKVTNSFTTYDATADREDLSNFIYNIDPSDTPLMSMIGRRNVSNVTFDWQVESLPAVDTTAQVEGFELARTASTATTRESNMAQILKIDATVTGTQESANAAGKGNGEMAHQMAIASKALKRNVEKVISSAQAKNAGNATTARTTAGLECWIQSNKSRGTGGGDGNAAHTTAPTDGTQRALTETILKAVIKTCYTSGAEPSVLMVGPTNKQTVSGFTGRSSAQQTIAADAIQASVAIYASDFGELKVVPSRWVRDRSAMLIDPEFAATSFYRPFQRKPIADIGDAKTEMMIVEFGLECRNEAAMGLIADLTT